MDNMCRQCLQVQISLLVGSSCVVAGCFAFTLVAGTVAVWHDGLGRQRAAMWWSSAYMWVKHHTSQMFTTYQITSSKTYEYCMNEDKSD